MKTPLLSRDIDARPSTVQKLNIEHSVQPETGNANLFIGWQVLDSGTYSTAYAAVTCLDVLRGYRWEH